MLDWFGRKLREMQEVKRDERGFTLIELLVVVIIIGILAAIAIPVFLSQRERAQEASAESDARNAATTAQTWASVDPQNGDYTGLDEDILEANGAQLSAENSWGTVTGDTDSFSIQVEAQNGAVYTFDSAGSPQMQRTAPAGEEEEETP